MPANKHEHIIKYVEPGSIAEEMEIEIGDVLLMINEKPIRDIFDYHYFMQDDFITVVIRKPDGEEWELEIEKEYDEELGITFENGLMDNYRSCYNKCVFCFIDQNPPGMRETIYFKDDDSRLSFLQGNYITLTNMSDEDVERIIEYKLAPINISVHTTNPKLRCEMLHNRFAGEALKKIDRFYEAGIPMNGQIVLCKGLNDGAELDRTLSDLIKYLPYMESVSVVPVGLSDYRDGLCKLEPFEPKDAAETIDIIEKYQRIAFEKYGTHFIHASDEWYITAGRDFPNEDNYDGYIQLENGVGMCRLFMTEVEEGISLYSEDEDILKRIEVFKKSKESHERARVSLITGRISAPLITAMTKKVMEHFPYVDVRVYPIVNHFFGERITVTGLITGGDIIDQLKDMDLGEKLIVPSVSLKADEDIFLDDVTLDEVAESLKIKVDVSSESGVDFVRSLVFPEKSERILRAAMPDELNHGLYEQ
ncbi:MAG: DUF512 domain-containing protein [Lachnospiraceae bacterium]|nr:DUF512 domain-containing protein [Lachnospiraceae bacterium]